MTKLSKHMQSLLLNWPAKVLSLVFALLVYVFIQYSTLGARVVTLPLEVSLPPSLEAQSLVPTSVEVIIRGDEDVIYLINPNAIEATIDFSEVTEEGISTSLVVLTYDERVFDGAGISLVANPNQYRILFAQRSLP
ncbi:MAG: CdaR family protein [Sphaerochaeta sp.]|uniref:CdaR family protein n=1 Tax=Sphaerochaeta sp. TaxID=1972642 RepID=UPI002970D771|nr:CdaR family protein [uncultured Sphaerochaeta sp.]MDD3928423.1 CdaR family protein [Sphaerochaeta sp.]